ncbi:MAG: PilZ domain-containing protein [candidate division Zixibacteria bacterium]|nr:PilZ domain-containing protein [candidate division Zixibacteria bacterium]
MRTKEKVKFVKDVETESTELAARKPFRVDRENKRRFIRLQISSPMTMKKIKDAVGNFWPEGDWHMINGTILNISAGGVLVDIDQPLLEGDVVCMYFTLQEVECLDNVLGLVKRVDGENGFFLAGIEFITRDYLNDLFSRGELEMLPNDLTNFDESVREVLNKYVYAEKVSRQVE